MKDVFADPEDGDRQWASHPPFDRKHLRAIELALRAAWEKLHANYATATELSNSKEERISHLLREALDELRLSEKGGVEGYTHQYFETPHVGAEMRTPDDKVRKPDIIFKLVGQKRPGVSKALADAIFVECKILQNASKGKGRNVKAYCNDGVHRFVEGSYAALMREGMMVAYVRASQSLPGSLAQSLETDEMKAHLASDGKLSKCTLTRIEPRVYISVHRRDWPYPGTDTYPGPIEIRHLWLHV